VRLCGYSTRNPVGVYRRKMAVLVFTRSVLRCVHKNRGKMILVFTEIRMGLAEIVFRSTDTFEDNPLRYQTRVSDTAKLQ